MDGAYIAAASPKAGGASSSASSASSYGGSASGRSWLRKGVHLRRRRRRVVAVKGGERAGGGDVQDLALPLGMSFAAVLAQGSGMYLASFTSRLRGGKTQRFNLYALRAVQLALPCLDGSNFVRAFARICSWLLLIH